MFRLTCLAKGRASTSSALTVLNTTYCVQSNVQIRHVQRVFLNEIAARFDDIAHQLFE